MTYESCGRYKLSNMDENEPSLGMPVSISHHEGRIQSRARLLGLSRMFLQRLSFPQAQLAFLISPNGHFTTNRHRLHSYPVSVVIPSNYESSSSTPRLQQPPPSNRGHPLPPKRPTIPNHSPNHPPNPPNQPTHHPNPRPRRRHPPRPKTPTRQPRPANRHQVPPLAGAHARSRDRQPKKPESEFG